MTHAIERLEGGEADCLIVTELARPVFSARAEHLAAAKRRILDGEARTIVSVRRAMWMRADAILRLKEQRMAERKNQGGIAGISTGGILVIIGIVLMIVWSFWIGLIIVVVGLIAFGGFARGKWY